MNQDILNPQNKRIVMNRFYLTGSRETTSNRERFGKRVMARMEKRARLQNCMTENQHLSRSTVPYPKTGLRA